VVILAREFLITGARALAASAGVVIPASIWGKTKAVLQMVYVYLFMPLGIIGQLLKTYQSMADWMPGAVQTYGRVLEQASLWAIVFVAAVTIFSGVQFMRENWHTLNAGNNL
jgi:CDP-diacylglycerol---glycerol-3-phosphate 3-phosphatidyltransferase